MTKTAELYGGSLYDLAVEENAAAAMMEELDGIQKIYQAPFRAFHSQSRKNFSDRSGI